MPWQPASLNPLILKAKDLIKKHFSILSETQVYCCTLKEMEEAVIHECTLKEYSEEKIEIIKQYYLPVIIGKYFGHTNEIWLIPGKGDSLDTLMHELIHSIQICEPNRENIADYITYKLTGLRSDISDELIQEWEEIEKLYGFTKIKKQILLEKDCEDFS